MKGLNFLPRYSLFAMLAVTGTLAVVRVWSGQRIGAQPSPLSVAQMRDGAIPASFRVQRVGDVPPDIRDSRGDLHVQFVNETRGWLSAGKKFWRTVDGGQHWLFVYDASPDSIRQFEFIDAVTGWMLTTARLYKKDDFIPSRYLSPDEKRVLRGVIFYTEDGGENWQRQLLAPSWGNLTVLFALDDEHAWAAGTAGGFYLTTGKWKAMNSDGAKAEGRPAVKSLDIQIGFPTIGPASIFFLNPSLGWLSNSNGYLARSSDGGKEWQDIFPPVEIQGDPPDDFTKVFFTDQMNGWACGYERGLYVTHDGGFSWERENSKIDFKAMYVLSSGEGWAVSQQGLFHFK